MRSFVLSPAFDIALFVVAVTARSFVVSPAFHIAVFVVAVTVRCDVLSPALLCLCHSNVYTHMFMCTVCTVCVCYVCIHIHTHK